MSSKIRISLFYDLDVAVFVIDAATELIVDTNVQGTALLGRSRRQILGTHYTELHLSAKAEQYKQLSKSLVKQGHVRKYYAEIIRKDGKIIPVMIHTSNIKYKGRQLVLALAYDITECKKAQEELKKSEEKYRSLYEYSRDCIVSTDLNDKIIDANRAYCEMLGYSKEEITKLTYKQLTPLKWHDMEEHIVQSQVFGRGYSDEYEKEYVKKDGRVFPISIRVWLIKNEKGEPVGMWGIIRDITEQKRMRQNMQFYITEITRAQEKERKRIARDLHDDVAQSLATLSLELQSIIRSRERLSKKTSQRLERLKTEIENTVKHVRQFSHELRPEILDQLGLFPAVQYLTTELNKGGKIYANLEVTGSKRRLAVETELALFRIIQEALRNVIRHAEATEVQIKVEFGESKIRIAVTDNGKGFNVPTNIVEFAREGKLGLIGMEEWASMVGGNLTINSQPDEGSRVIIEL